ncbi:glycosyltransferase [Marinobacter sp. C2H3]|uniref:glycosyltransferase n=1 Tax=Marinobacter sp. C2H3 TaxID=3119003 RepID=UPI00300F5664
MRVLQFYRTYLPETHGGVEEAIRQICIGTQRFGIEHRVLTLAPVKQQTVIQRPEAQVIQVPLQLEPASCSMGIATFSAYREAARWADLIHVHYPWPFADLVHTLSRVHKPLVLTYHSDIIRQNALEKLYAPLRGWFFRSVTRFVATSPDYAASSPILQGLGSRVSVIPLGLEPESYSNASPEAQEQVRTAYGHGYFLFIGVLRYYKGLRYLIEAAALSGLPVVIAGHGPEAEALKQQAERAGAPNVKFAGFVSDDIKQALMENARAVVFPSCERSEAFGVTLLEGQMHGLPLISCDIGTGTSYVNQNGLTGLVVPPRNAGALAEAMVALAQDPERAQMMGRAGRERFEAHFSGRQVGERYSQLYRELYEHNTNTPPRTDR